MITLTLRQEKPKRVILTDRAIAKMRPTAREDIPDIKVPGLFLRVTPAGAKTWCLRYSALGQRRRMKLGAYGRMTLAKARQAARHELALVDAGKDPMAERQRATLDATTARQHTIADLCTAYIDRHAKPKKKTWRADQGHLNREILPKWKRRPVASITRRECRSLVQGVADRGAPIVANRIAALLSRLFRFAVDEEIIDSNPAARLPKPGVEAAARTTDEAPQKAYTDDEIATLWARTEDLDAAPRALYRLGLLTGQRPSEITHMRWHEVDGAWWTLPKTRTKNGREHRVYLADLARLELARVSPLDDDPHVFAGIRGKRQIAAINARVFADLTPRLRPRHALRDTVATGLASMGLPTESIARVLNHTYGPRVTAGYNAYRYDREKQEALVAWSAHVEALARTRSR